MSTLWNALGAGWHQYADYGMYIGVFFGALLFLWLVCFENFKKGETPKESGKGKLFIFALGMTLLILCPVSAFVLLKYQTAFFTYSQLFLMLPMLPVVAWGLTELVIWLRENVRGKGKTPLFLQKRPWLYELFAVVICTTVLWLAGSLSFANEPTQKAVNAEKVPAKVLQVFQTLEEAEVTDWTTDVMVAEDKVLEYARGYSGEFRLLYGRNMWQKELNAYTYDVYTPELESFHQWMNATANGLYLGAPKISVERAVEILAGTNCTILVVNRKQYDEPVIMEALGNRGFKAVAETPDYVILKR